MPLSNSLTAVASHSYKVLMGVYESVVRYQDARLALASAIAHDTASDLGLLQLEERLAQAHDDLLGAIEAAQEDEETHH